LRQSFEDWYADEIVKQLNENKGSKSEDEVIQPVDLSLTWLNSLSAKWLVKMVQHINNNPEIVRKETQTQAGETINILIRKCPI
jgi:Rod binding domain-containing protein